MIQALGLIDNEQHFFMGGIGFVEKILQIDQKCALAVEFFVHFEFDSQEIEEIQTT